MTTQAPAPITAAQIIRQLREDLDAVPAANLRRTNVLTQPSDCPAAPSPADPSATPWRVVRVDTRNIEHPVAAYASRDDAVAVAWALNDVERGMDYYEVA